jgi:hypothetical protein
MKAAACLPRSSLKPEPGLADEGDLEPDLQTLFEKGAGPRNKPKPPWRCSSTNCNTYHRRNLPP